MEEKESKSLEGKAMITVRRTQVGKVLEDSSEEETIHVRKFETEPAYVSVRVGATKNMGNYESLRLEVGVTIPCYTEEITEVEKQATEWVDDKMDKKLSELSNKVI